MAMLNKLFLVLLLSLSCSFQMVFGAQNEEAEDHCRAFLTDAKTAPIYDKAVRDLSADKEAEKWCRLVLEDNQLPMNIRGVVLEGLVHLLMVHTTMGLEDRKDDAYELHQALVMNFPDNARFLYRAASYAADVMGKPEEALQALRARIKDVRESTDDEVQDAAAARGLLDHLESIEASKEEL
jgi:hypothetical protein